MPIDLTDDKSTSTELKNTKSSLLSGAPFYWQIAFNPSMDKKLYSL